MNSNSAIKGRHKSMVGHKFSADRGKYTNMGGSQSVMQQNRNMSRVLREGEDENNKSINGNQQLLNLEFQTDIKPTNNSFVENNADFQRRLNSMEKYKK